MLHQADESYDYRPPAQDVHGAANAPYSAPPHANLDPLAAAES